MRHWQDKTSKSQFICPYCERDKLKQNPNIIGESIIIPIALKRHILSQNKWSLIEYNGSHNEAIYKCNDCGKLKYIRPHSLFTGRNFSCISCNKLLKNKIDIEKEEENLYDY